MLLAVIAVVAGPGAAPARASNGLVAPARCVSDYLEAVAAAAPPRPRGVPPPPTSTGAGPRWTRARSYLAPRAAASLETAHAPRPLAPWSTLGRDGAFLGYELLAVRRAPLGAAVVVARVRTARSPDAAPTVTVCAYLVGPVGRLWRIADERCDRDFADAEVASNYDGLWDEPDRRGGGAPLVRGPLGREPDPREEGLPAEDGTGEDPE